MLPLWALAAFWKIAAVCFLSYNPQGQIFHRPFWYNGLKWTAGLPSLVREDLLRLLLCSASGRLCSTCHLCPGISKPLCLSPRVSDFKVCCQESGRMCSLRVRSASWLPPPELKGRASATPPPRAPCSSLPTCSPATPALPSLLSSLPSCSSWSKTFFLPPAWAPAAHCLHRLS